MIVRFVGQRLAAFHCSIERTIDESTGSRTARKAAHRGIGGRGYLSADDVDIFHTALKRSVAVSVPGGYQPDGGGGSGDDLRILNRQVLDFSMQYAENTSPTSVIALEVADFVILSVEHNAEGLVDRIDGSPGSVCRQIDVRIQTEIGIEIFRQQIPDVVEICRVRNDVGIGGTAFSYQFMHPFFRRSDQLDNMAVGEGLRRRIERVAENLSIAARDPDIDSLCLIQVQLAARQICRKRLAGQVPACNGEGETRQAFSIQGDLADIRGTVRQVEHEFQAARLPECSAVLGGPAVSENDLLISINPGQGCLVTQVRKIAVPRLADFVVRICICRIDNVKTCTLGLPSRKKYQSVRRQKRV